MGKGFLVHHEKRILENGLILEANIWSIERSEKYPTGLKYRLICVNPTSNKQILFDNHHPKGPHYHVDRKEFNYDFKSIEKLLLDFQSIIQEKLGVTL